MHVALGQSNCHQRVVGRRGELYSNLQCSVRQVVADVDNAPTDWAAKEVEFAVFRWPPRAREAQFGLALKWDT